MTNYDVGQLAKEINEIRKRLDNYATGSRGDSLNNSSFQVRQGQGGIGLYDGSTIRGFIGSMPDGTVNSVSVNNMIPPAIPLNPIVVASIAGATVYARKDPDIPLPWDHSHFNVYVNDQNIGTLQLPPDSLPIGPLAYGVPAGVQLTSVNLSGTESAKTDYVYVTPLKVVGNDVTDGIITDLKIANNAIKEAKIDINAVTETKIANNSISTLKIVSNAITSDKIIANAITSDKIVSNAITADKILVNTITGDKIAANTIDTGVIKAGAITASKLEANLALVTRIVAGNVEMNSGGFLAKNSSGVTTFSVDTSGNLLLQGTFRTALAGQRLVINENNSNSIRFYPSSGTRYAYLQAYNYDDGINYNGGLSFQTPTDQYSNFSQFTIHSAGLSFELDRGTPGGSYLIPGFLTYGGNGLVFGLSTGAQFSFGVYNNNRPLLAALATGNPSIIFNATGLDIMDSQANIYRAVGASAFVVQSSEEVKENIRAMDMDPLKIIENAPAMLYELKDTEDNNLKLGPIAEKMPSNLNEMMENGILGINLDNKIGIVWAACQKLNDRLDKLEGRIGNARI